MAFRSVSTLGNLRSFLGLDELRLGSKKFKVAVLLIIIGVVGRLLLLNLANIETVLVASLLAGTYLSGIYVIIVPVSIMLMTDAIVYITKYPGFYPLGDIALLAVFIYSGYILVSLFGATTRRRLVFRLKSIAILTAISIPATILFDIWTATGMWVTIFGKAPFGYSIWQTYAMQVPFTCLHIISALVFVPIFGTIFLYYLSESVDVPTMAITSSDDT